jgi:type I restriction enzyme S subunit
MSDVPRGWIKAPVTEFVALHDNRRIPLNAKQREKMHGKYPYYGANGLVDHVNDYLFDGEYALLAEDGGYFDDPKRGVAYDVSGKFWVNNHAHILEPLGDMSNRFLRHSLNAFNWMPYVGGTTRLKLTQGGFRRRKSRCLRLQNSDGSWRRSIASPPAPGAPAISSTTSLGWSRNTSK